MVLKRKIPSNTHTLLLLKTCDILIIDMQMVVNKNDKSPTLVILSLV
jgi:hypothetical protein